MATIICTGTPGTGKTKIAKLIAKKYSLDYVDVGEEIRKNKLYSYYDKKLCSYVIDKKKLVKLLRGLVKKHKNAILDSHLSHYLDKKHVKLCIVVKCDIGILKKRLEKRRYNKKKIRENLDAEIFYVCLVEAIELGHRVVVVDTSKGFKNVFIDKVGK